MKKLITLILIVFAINAEAQKIKVSEMPITNIVNDSTLIMISKKMVFQFWSH